MKVIEIFYSSFSLSPRPQPHILFIILFVSQREPLSQITYHKTSVTFYTAAHIGIQGV